MNKVAPYEKPNQILRGVIGVAKMATAAARIMPGCGGVADAADNLLYILEQYQCNIEAATKLSERLRDLYQLLFDGTSGLLHAATQNPNKSLLATFVNDLKTIFEVASEKLEVFSKKGFLMKLIEGNVPKQLFDDVDRDITQKIQYIQTTLAVDGYISRSKTYKIITEIPMVKDAQDLNEILKVPSHIERLAKDIGADMETLKDEMMDTLIRMEAKIDNISDNVTHIDGNVAHIDDNVNALKDKMTGLTTQIEKITRDKDRGGTYDQILLNQLQQQQAMAQSQMIQMMQNQQIQALQSQKMDERLAPSRPMPIFREEKYFGPISLILCLFGIPVICCPCDSRQVPIHYY